MEMQKEWWLGFLGFVGLYKLPLIIGFFNASGSLWDLASAVWLLCFLYFIPEPKQGGPDMTRSQGRFFHDD
jgi:hypothetical protein